MLLSLFACLSECVSTEELLQQSVDMSVQCHANIAMLMIFVIFFLLPVCFIHKSGTQSGLPITGLQSVFPLFIVNRGDRLLPENTRD